MRQHYLTWGGAVEGETDGYTYQVLAIEADDVLSGAIARNPQGLNVIGGVYIINDTTQTILCAAFDPSSAPPEPPILEGDTLTCGADSRPVGGSQGCLGWEACGGISEPFIKSTIPSVRALGSMKTTLELLLSPSF